MASRSTGLGSSSLAWVMGLSLMNEGRSWGRRGVSLLSAVWLGNLISFGVAGGTTVVNGVMSTGSILGPPATVKKVPCASMVVPWGIDAIRVSVGPSFGLVVDGTMIQMPGSRWMPIGFFGSLTSLMVCRYGTPLRKTSPCSAPRFGTEPRLGENDRTSLVRLSSRMLSLVFCGIGSGVGVMGLFGRKMVLKPWPCQSPTKSASGPRFGAACVAANAAGRLT